MNEATWVMKFLDTYGVLGMFVIFTFALWKKWLIPGWVLEETTREYEKRLVESETRCTEIKEERDELLRFHIRGLRTFSKVVSGRELAPRPGILPEPEE